MAATFDHIEKFLNFYDYRNSDGSPSIVSLNGKFYN